MRAVTTFMVLSTLFIIGCELDRETDTENPFNGERHQVNLTHETIDSPMVLLDDSFIYMNMGGTIGQGQATYYRHYFEGDTVVAIGTIFNFLISTKFVALVDNILFFHVGINADNTTDFSTVLYGINLNDNKLRPYYTNNDAAPITTDYECNGKVISLMRASTNNTSNIFRAYLNLYDVKTDTVEKKHEWVFDRSSMTGSACLNFCIDDGKIYMLIEDGNGTGNNTRSIKVYDDSMNILRTISIDEVHDYIMESNVGEIAVFGEYIFMSNYSSYALIGRIENNAVKPLVQERALEQSMNQFKKDRVVFLVRRTNKCYLLNVNNKTLSEFHAKVNAEHWLTYGLSTEEKFLFLSRTDNGNDIVYLYTY